jgi:hypothetical protein
MTMADDEPVRIVLTPEQREVIHRLSGQNIDAIELTPDGSDKTGGVLKFLWRLSAATGIPRQQWVKSVPLPPQKTD